MAHLPGAYYREKSQVPNMGTHGRLDMLGWAIAFFIIAIIAAVFGFGGIAAGAASIAKILFIIFLILFVLSLIFGLVRRGKTNVSV